jgi:hypothetical protein
MAKLDSPDPFTNEIRDRGIRGPGNAAIKDQDVHAALQFIAHAPPMNSGSPSAWLLISSWVRAVVALDRLNWVWQQSPSTTGLEEDKLDQARILSGNRNGLV